MALTETGTLPADALMQDDWFCLGGTMMRIKDITREEFSMYLTIHFYCPEDTALGGELKLMKIHPIKLYNHHEE